MPIADLHKLWDASLAQHHTDVQTARPLLYVEPLQGLLQMAGN